MSNAQMICERLVESGLETEPAAEAHLARWQDQAGLSEPPGGAEEFVSWLVNLELLTEFQGQALLAGHTGPFMLGPYRVCEHVAFGRLGGMFRAVHEEFEQPVCLKVFPSELSKDPEKLGRMRREARIFAELNHPNVVRPFQIGRVGQIYYLALEELHGESLDARIQRQGRLPFDEACRLARDAAKGLAHLHENEVVHRDVRPETIWVTQEGVPKLMEFSAARDALAYVDALDEGIDESLADCLHPGHFDYMAPEQARDPHQTDPRSDLYALGCTLYHCLTGRPPFVQSHPVRLVLQHATLVPTPVSQWVDDVPHPFEETLAGMLAKDPQQRFPTATDVVYALDQYVEHEPEQVAVVDVSPAYLRWLEESHPPSAEHRSNSSVGVNPELTRFLGWLTNKTRRRRPSRRRV